MEYKLVQGTQETKPKELEIGKTTVYKRRNIERITDVDENDRPIEYWQYEEKQMTFREFALEVAGGEN